MFVVYLFLRNARAALIPCVAVPLSLIGTFVVMYVLGFSLDNMSLMALTVATGFVVDDAIVVLENVTRYVEQGMSRLEATIKGAREVGFTVVAMSLSLIAVFLPILLMGGIIGMFFREFAVTLATAIVISLIISLTTTPMLCAHLDIHKQEDEKQGWLLRRSERGFEWGKSAYASSLRWALLQSAHRDVHPVRGGGPEFLSLLRGAQGTVTQRGYAARSRAESAATRASRSS